MYVNTNLFLVTTFVTVLSSFAQLIVSYVLSLLFKESFQSRNTREEITKTRTEMSQISMMDEFARYARLQRKLVKLQDELKAEKTTVSCEKLKYKVLIGSVVTILTGFCMLLMLYMYRSEPVLVLPEKWLSPFSSIISWPSQESGAVSVLSWIAVCGSVSRLLAGKLS